MYIHVFIIHQQSLINLLLKIHIQIYHCVTLHPTKLLFPHATTTD